MAPFGVFQKRMKGSESERYKVRRKVRLTGWKRGERPRDKIKGGPLGHTI